MAIKDYNVDPDLNVQISGINIAEGCPPSGINNAIRQLMADVKAEQDVRGEEWATQAAKDDEQDAAIAEAQSSAEAAVSELSTELGALGAQVGALGAQVGALETEVEGKADAEVDGKGVVRTVNGVSADAAGNVTVATPKAYITESWSSGTSWYRKWSDGWIEQGGWLAFEMVGSAKTCTYQVPFSNTNYTLVSTSFGQKSTLNNSDDFAIRSRNSSSFSYFRISTSNGYTGRSWYACGY